ncbi:MAG: NAD(P)-dependent oxidoreductase [Proteobacteria bacterium]|nr:NAD(P)-dependent oxidoreductase [Pseudomonadota bacterium]
MKLALIGATGSIGSRILDEALSRGHIVTAITRDPSKIKPRKHLTVKKGDASNTDVLVGLLAGTEALISAFNAGRGTPNYADALRTGYAAIVAAARKAKVRLLVVGGAGSLKAGPGLRLMDTPHFPAEYRVEAQMMGEVLDSLGREDRLEWTFLSPSATIMPGKRTGRYRLGVDHVLKDASGKSIVSMEDYAVAMLDETERPAHTGSRFTVGY